MGNLKELKMKAKESNLRGYSKMRKQDLVNLLTEKLGQNWEQDATFNRLTTDSSDVGDTVITQRSTPRNRQTSDPSPLKQVTQPNRPAKPKNIWNQFLSEYSVQHNVGLKEAMKQKEAYQTWKSERSAPNVVGGRNPPNAETPTSVVETPTVEVST